jgi:hypothetical protein
MRELRAALEAATRTNTEAAAAAAAAPHPRVESKPAAVAISPATPAGAPHRAAPRPTRSLGSQNPKPWPSIWLHLRRRAACMARMDVNVYAAASERPHVLQ